MFKPVELSIICLSSLFTSPATISSLRFCFSFWQKEPVSPAKNHCCLLIECCYQNRVVVIVAVEKSKNQQKLAQKRELVIFSTRNYSSLSQNQRINKNWRKKENWSFFQPVIIRLCRKTFPRTGIEPIPLSSSGHRLCRKTFPRTGIEPIPLSSSGHRLCRKTFPRTGIEPIPLLLRVIVSVENFS